MSKYYRKMSVKVRGYSRYDPRAKRMVRVKPHTRNQKVRDYTYSNRVIHKQIKEEDWSHFSNNYSNIIGLTDEEIEAYIKNTPYDKEEIKEYIKHIKCYNQEDIREISKKAFKKFEDIMNKKNPTEYNKNPYYKDSTIFITSPRGGFDVLSDFGYANSLRKKHFPYDLERYGFTNTGPTLKSESLPYGESINDVNDIVFIDDIYMSGEQCERAHKELTDKIKELNISKEELPRLHYMTMVGNKNTTQGKHEWETFIVGEEYSFKRDGKNFEEVSAVVFPFSIPDGERHNHARKLYSTKRRFAHRKY